MGHKDAEWHTDETWCPNCKTYTTQNLKWSGHERDSTHDKAICLTCKWEYNGYNGQYEPPYDTERLAKERHDYE